MKLSEQWLREWVNPALSAAQIGEQLTMAGLEIDGLDQVAKDFSGVVVAEVLSVAPHPDADRLKVVQVTTGDEPIQIVCGASNVAKGVKVPLATVGAVLPAPDKDGKPLTIKKGKLRGVVSNGMLCGGMELDLDDGVDGLLILPDDAPIGQDLREYLNLDSHIFDIAITPNRGDCLSVRGIAREVAAINALPFALPFEHQTPKQATDERIGVTVTTHACPHYSAQVLTDLNNTQSPPWLQNALKTSAISPKNVLVDVTNFVMMELGQPLHAFDKDKIVGAIVVRLAKNGETFTLLNEQTITLTGDELVIADDEGVLALAGIMGGKRAAVSDDTCAIVLESAFFDPIAIAGRARRFGLHTDASQRFERGVDFALVGLARARAVALLCEYACAKVGAISEHKDEAHLPKRAPIRLDYAKIGGLLGVDIDKACVLDLLAKLQIDTQDHGEYLLATPPSHRFDLSIGADLTEEVARLYGYERIDNRLPSFLLNFNDDPAYRLTMKQQLVALGYFEAISFSFCDLATEQLLDPSVSPLALANPISSELSVMRTTLLASLLPCVVYNLKRQSQVRLFEMGTSFVGASVSAVQQAEKLTLIASDSTEQRWQATPLMDFYDLKADIEKLLPSHSKVSYAPCTLSFLHSGQSAELIADGKRVGFLGQLHPKVTKALGLPTLWVAELCVATLLSLFVPRPIIAPSKFPKVRRDVAFIVDKDVTWQAIWQVVKAHAEDKLVDGWVFDVYEGDSLPEGKKSLAFAMVWQDPSATLDDEEIKALFWAVIRAIEHEFAATLRDGTDKET